MTGWQAYTMCHLVKLDWTVVGPPCNKAVEFTKRAKAESTLSAICMTSVVHGLRLTKPDKATWHAGRLGQA